MRKRIAHGEALFYEESLKKEINEDRAAHGKKPLKDKDDDKHTPPASGGRSDGHSDEIPSDVKTVKH